jgi:hypothetical protein
MLELAVNAVGVAVAAYTYSQILTKAGMILNGWYNWLDRTIGFGTEEKARVPWLFYPLIYCPKCVAGQFGLWSYFVLYPYHGFSLRHILLHALFVTFAIYSIKFVEQAYKWQTKS